MNIYEYLKLDHEHVSQLFHQFEKSKILTRKKQIVFLIAQELLVHAHSEQETFYRALQLFETTKENAVHGKKEHKEIEEQINLILHSQEFGASWVKKVEKLKEIVEHHVKEEEGAIFTKAQKVLSKEDAYDLKEKMHYLKQYLLLSLKKESYTLGENKNKTIIKSAK
ncbi:hemerythrin domain-containing protein [Legionella sainthelensi]|uniref:Hemerythrin-like domain-containing protein n=1 Tax=Legionella sainthelensi TaxID=28087 RepID=A0A2H5FRU9_9GAMM|nr:hemerythrin domain-containing protein [Legionella sainthelensi]AUH74281.1 hemerythrin domain-containing protein [Legionella sainthelensi]